MSALLLSGWGQAARLPFEGTCVDYGDCASVEALWDVLARHATTEVCIGWSLGGQLASRAVAAGVISPRRLVLIAAPYRWVARVWPKEEGFPRAEVPQTLAEFYLDPPAFLRNFARRIPRGDTDVTVGKRLPPAEICARNWGSWLQELASFDADILEFKKFPKTLIVHGAGDGVIHPDNATRFAKRLSDGEVWNLPGVAHAPHLHEAVVRRIQEWLVS